MSAPLRRSARATGANANAAIRPQSALPKDGEDLVALAEADEEKVEIFGFWASRFMKAVNLPSTAPADNLDNNIHPLFQKRNFPGADYNVVKLPARLASKLIQSSALKPILYTMLNTDPKRLRRHMRRGRRKYAYPSSKDWRKVRVVGGAARRIARRLEALASMVRFECGERLLSGAVTIPCEQDRLKHPDFPKGLGSNIWYARSLYERLTTVTKHADDWPRLRTTQFEFAITMVHEVFHALFVASTVNTPTNPSSTKAEIGFEVETRLFGGHITALFDEDGTDREIRLHYLERKAKPRTTELRLRQSQFKGLTVIRKWPYRGLILQYNRNSHRIDVQKRKLPKLDLAWRLSMRHFANLFTNAFSRQAEGRHDLRLLQPSMRVGHFFCADRNGTRTPEAPRKSRISEGCRLETGIDMNTVLIRTRV